MYTKENELILCFSKEENITIDEGIESIASSAFCATSNLKTLNLPNSLTKIGYMAFMHMTKIENINIGKNVTDINALFKYKNYLGTVTIDKDNEKYCVKNNALYSKDGKTLISVLNYIQGEYVVDSGVEKIGSRAFHAQGGMTSIVLPDNLKEIGGSLNYCSGLTRVDIPSSVTKISNNCFENSESISKIIVHKKKNTISGAPWGATQGARIVEWQEN